jgi:hypothetical protein
MPPVPAVARHWLAMQVIPLAQGRLQPPQFVLLLVVSTQALPHSIWPATEQPQTPLLQALAPAGQALQPPQCAIVLSPPFVTHAVPHSIWPEGHIPVQALLLQTCPLGQTVQLGPQWVASDGTHCPPQLRRPVAHWHVPLAQARPAPQALPHEPQFWGSVATVLHWPVQSIWPAAQLAPLPPVPGVEGVLGVAQLAASVRHPKAMVSRREGERGRVFIALPRR